MVTCRFRFGDGGMFSELYRQMQCIVALVRHFLILGAIIKLLKTVWMKQ